MACLPIHANRVSKCAEFEAFILCKTPLTLGLWMSAQTRARSELFGSVALEGLLNNERKGGGKLGDVEKMVSS